ncbi:MAG: TlpA family protein disulfide reductase [Muribaculaceae bacterium]|nr:TlpA family protein disulfide reductase [Muribaculaceae bacterium]
MKIKNLSRIFAVGLFGLALFGCGQPKVASLNVTVSDKDKFEGKTIEIVSFADSTILASSVITDGKAKLIFNDNDSVQLPLFTQIMVDGRTRAYYIMEAGNAQFSDSVSVASMTPLNDKFTGLLAELDSIENLDDMNLYLDYAEKVYNDNKDNPIGAYFGVEWIKYAEPQKVDSFLNVAPVDFRAMRKVKQCEESARHRALTAPGEKYTDFAGETERGKKIKLSSLIKPGKYTLIDFWASWCPYCIKELPDLQQLYADFGDKDLEIIGVAVRDKTEDTANMVAKHNLTWPVMYNTQRVPYDIYGFSGIPHHILLDPDGVIVSRGETAAQIRQRLEAAKGETAN